METTKNQRPLAESVSELRLALYLIRTWSVKWRLKFASTLVNGLVGLTTNRFLQIYITSIRPCMEYALPVWLPYVINTDCHWRKLLHLQNMVLRMATGALRTTPGNSLEVWTGIKPLEVRFKEISARLYSRTIRLDHSHPLRRALKRVNIEFHGHGPYHYACWSPFKFSMQCHEELGTRKIEDTGPVEMTNVTPIVNPVPAPSEWHDDDAPWHEIEDEAQLPTLKNRNHH